MIPDLKKLLYDERIRQLGLWTLEERRNRADLLQVFQMYKGLSSATVSYTHLTLPTKRIV